MRDPRHDILFEPVEIGPVTARNRFYQVPHCNGMGHQYPNSVAAMRGVKAEGGWAVVCTEEAEIHPTSDLSPFIELRNWDDTDVGHLSLVAHRIHEHGALAGIELVHNGLAVANRFSREIPLGPAALPVTWLDPVQARRMDRRDLADLRRWHRAAVTRSIAAGFDIVYVYAGHMMTVIQQFLSPRFNDRDDEYGGSLENRARLLREVLEDAAEEASGRAAIACRLCVDEMIGSDGLQRQEVAEVVAMLSEHPDVWDFQLGSWDYDSVSSRFGEESGQEEYVRGLKKLTPRPVVGVGRFTSPDEMVRQITSGVLDLIGAARPSIADPFLPRKIEEGRPEDIRECIGCNICVTGDHLGAPIRCTQNPSMGEEWRRGWHPEYVRPAPRPSKVLVVGAGPAGLEAAHTLGKRGFEVVMVEATRHLGGRVAAEANLPGLAAWRRVVDYRLGQIDKLGNVDYYLESVMTADDALAYGFKHVCLATGSQWRSDGVGRWHTRPIETTGSVAVSTPTELMAGRLPDGEHIVVFDDDHYYMGGVLAELLAAAGRRVTVVTPEPLVSAWTVNTMEQTRVHHRLAGLDVALRPLTAIAALVDDGVVAEHAVTGVTEVLECDAVVMVTGRTSNDSLGSELRAARPRWEDSELQSVREIGDAHAPGTIAAAVWSGHRYASELEEPVTGDAAFLRDRHSA